MTTRSLAVLTATVGALRRSTNYSTSGTMTASVKPWGPASCSGTALLTGYFGSTGLARHISTKWHRVRARTTSAQCLLSPTSLPKRETGSAAFPFDRSRRAPPTSFTRRSFTAKKGFDYDKARKPSRCVARLGKWCAGFIPMTLTIRCPILGTE